ncbi:hypothetical protein V8F06_006993 [Rhypophila decipiens]
MLDWKTDPHVKALMAQPNWHKTLRKTIAVLSNDDPDYTAIHEKWSTTICDGILDLLKSLPTTNNRVNSIAVFHMGYNITKPTDNPKTVYVAVDYDTPEEEFPGVLDKTQEYLDGFGLGLVAFIEHGETWGGLID